MQDAIAVQSLKTDIALLRQHIFPPQYLEHVEGLPIYYGLQEEVLAYYQQWKDLIERAQELFQPFMEDELPDAIHLPSHLNLPLFFFHVDRIRINKTRAKESKTFRGVASLIERCGQFETDQIFTMQEWLQSDDTAALVAHREFIDLRAYVFCRNPKGELLEPERIRFYRTGLVIQTLADFKVVDSRQTPRKKRNDAYKNAIADNGIWKIFVKN